MVLRLLCLVYFAVLLFAASINYIPDMTDENGVAFGTFALDLGDDILHLFSAIWALLGAVWSARAARFFLTVFGLIYLADGVLGLVTGVGFLDAGYWTMGPQDYDIAFKLMANAPHLILGGVAVLAVVLVRK